MSRERDPLRRLAEANPVPDEDLRDAVRSDHARRTLDSILEREAAAHRSSPSRRGRVAVLGTVATILVALVLAQLPTARRRIPLDPTGVLLRTARVAATNPLPVPGPGQYLYVKTEVTTRSTFRSQGADWTALLPATRELWLDATGAGRIREVPHRPVFPGPRDRQLWRASGRPNLSGTMVDRRIAESERFTGPGLRVPSEPEAIRAWLLRRDASGLPPRVAPFVTVSDLLGQPLVDPQARAALFRFLGGLEGVELLGLVKDPLGREGTGVSMTTRVFGAVERRILIFDPETSQVLADEVRVLQRVPWMDGRPPLLTDAHVHVSSGIVDSVRQRISG